MRISDWSSDVCSSDLFAHKDDPDVPLGEVLGAFAELIDAGIVRAIGASNYSAERLAEALRIADEKGLPRFTAMQPELNLLDRDQYEGALQELCIAEGLGVVPYFSLASGYLRSEEHTSELQSLMR